MTLHGFAINCDTDLRWFDAIVPCGLTDRTVGSLSMLAGRPISVEDAMDPVARRFEEVFERRLVTAGPELARSRTVDPLAHLSMVASANRPLERNAR